MKIKYLKMLIKLLIIFFLNCKIKEINLKSINNKTNLKQIYKKKK